MARKAVASNPAERRSGVNRAQLKAMAARQAMTNIPTRAGEQAAVAEAPAAGIDLNRVALRNRRVVLTREQEFAYIRADLVRLLVVAVVLLAILIAITIYLG